MNAPAVRLRVDAVEDPQVICTLWRAGEQVGRVVFADWPVMVVCYELTVTTDVRPMEVVQVALSAVLQRWGEGNPPAHFIHVGLTDPMVLGAYLQSPLHRGALLTGTIASTVLYYDPLTSIEGHLLEQASDADELGPTGVVLTWAKDLEALAPGTTVSWDAVRTLLQSDISSARIGGLRTLARRDGVSDAMRDAAYMFALLDANYEVRRFASVNVSGFFPGIPYFPDIELLLRHLDDPLQSLDALQMTPRMPEGERWSDAHGRRNKRYGILWVIGALHGVSRPDDAALVAWQERAASWLMPRLLKDAAAHTPERDLALLNVAHAELVPGEARYGLGEPGGLSLLEMMRYVVLRHHLVKTAPNADQDRFYWLMEMVEAVVPSSAPPALYDCIYADVPEVRELESLPPWLHGRWAPGPMGVVHVEG
ncbi:MAG: hypothetical protein ACON4N_10760 [Myxococcota bacterium]